MSSMSNPDPLWSAAQHQFQTGDLTAARRSGYQILESNPRHSGAHLLLSNLASADGQHRVATRHALDAAERLGRQPMSHVTALSLKLISLGEYEPAIRLIAKINPQTVPAASSLAEFSQQLSLLDQHPEALRYMQAAIGYGLEGDWVRYMHGNTLKFLGELDAARDAYEHSLRLNPDYAFSHLALADLGMGDGAARVDRIRKCLARVGPGFRDVAYLHYALFRELDRLDAVDEAWPVLMAGAATKRRQLNHDASAETALFDRIIAATPQGFVPSGQPSAGSKTPIFVLGMPRTGTTLLERILGGHPDIALCGELNDFRMQFKWCSDHSCLGFFDTQAVDRIPAVDYAQLGERYLEHVAWRVPSAHHFTDKNPGNFMMAGLILRALPQARIINLRRNPMDTCFSNLKELFGSNAHPYSYGFEDLATHYANYSRLMQHWHALAPGRILDVHYEALVSDPDTSARRVMEFCGLDYQAQQIQVEASSAPVSTASATQVRQPIHRRNVAGWTRYAEPLAPLQQLLQGAISSS